MRPLRPSPAGEPQWSEHLHRSSAFCVCVEVAEMLWIWADTSGCTSLLVITQQTKEDSCLGLLLRPEAAASSLGLCTVLEAVLASLSDGPGKHHIRASREPGSLLLKRKARLPGCTEHRGSLRDSTLTVYVCARALLRESRRTLLAGVLQRSGKLEGGVGRRNDPGALTALSIQCPQSRCRWGTEASCSQGHCTSPTWLAAAQPSLGGGCRIRLWDTQPDMPGRHSRMGREGQGDLSPELASRLGGMSRRSPAGLRCRQHSRPRLSGDFVVSEGLALFAIVSQEHEEAG